MDIKEDFLFGDISDLDLTSCEEISINTQSQEQSKQTIMPGAASIKEVAPPRQVSVKSFSVSSADPNAILTVKQAAAYLQIRTETILRKIYAGELLAFKVGRIWRIKQAQIDEYLNKNISAQ